MHFSFTISLGQLAITLGLSALSWLVRRLGNKLLLALNIRLWQSDVTWNVINKRFPDDIPPNPYIPKRRTNGSL